jgi:hypothetical protein
MLEARISYAERLEPQWSRPAAALKFQKKNKNKNKNNFKDGAGTTALKQRKNK